MTTEQRPLVNSGHFSWVPRVVVVHKFYCILKRENKNQNIGKLFNLVVIIMLVKDKCVASGADASVKLIQAIYFLVSIPKKTAMVY